MRRSISAGILATLLGAGVAAAAVGDLGPQRQISLPGPVVDSPIPPRLALAYNSTRNEYLAVWSGPALAQEDREIFGRVVRAGGEPVGEQFQISSMGPSGDENYAADSPVVAYNPGADEYLVAWAGDDSTPPLVDGHQEIFVQRLTAAGLETGPDDLRISSMGPPNSTTYGGSDPAVAFNPTANEYLLAWSGDDDRAGLVPNEAEIFVQRLSPIGAEVGTDDARISANGPSENAAFDAFEPALALNSVANEYLVAWTADGQTPTQVDNETEIFVQRVSATGDQVGADDRRISTMGPDRDPDYSAQDASVVHNPIANEYLVAWQGEDPPADADEFEIIGQRLQADGTEVGIDDQRISEMGPDGTPSFDAQRPTAAFSPTLNEYLVAWSGNEDAQPLAGSEVYAQRLSAAGDPVGTDDQRISFMGTDGESGSGTSGPSAAFNPTTGEYLLAWPGREPPMGPSHREIFARAMSAVEPPSEQPPEQQPPAIDTTLDGATINLAKKLKIKGKELKIKLDAGCAEACTATATGAVTAKPGNGKRTAKAKRYKFAPATALAAAGQTSKLTLKLKGSKSKRKKATRKIVSAVRNGGKVKAAIAVTLTDAAGNAAVVDGSAKLTGKKAVRASAAPTDAIGKRRPAAGPEAGTR